MSRHDEIRNALRASDPAARRELGEVERARMRAVIVSTAGEGVRRRSPMPVLALGTAMATVLVAAVLLLPRSEREIPKPVVVPAVAIAAPVPTPIVPPVVKTQRPRTRRPRPAVVESQPVQTTRIVFTAPGGTRILWFVGPSDAKELGS